MKKLKFYLVIVAMIMFLSPVKSVRAQEILVTPFSGIGTVCVESGAPLCSAPDLEHCLMIALPYGVPVQVTGISSNQWYEISIEGVTYYIPNGFLSFGVVTKNYVRPDYQQKVEYEFNDFNGAITCLKDGITRHAEQIVLKTHSFEAYESLAKIKPDDLYIDFESDYSNENWWMYTFIAQYAVENKQPTYVFTFFMAYRESFEEDLYVEAFVNEMVPQIQTLGSTYNKIRFVHDFICYTVDYDATEEENELFYQIFGFNMKKYDSAFNCLANDKSICTGYSLLFQKFMDQLNIPCYLVKNAEGDHVWNLVYVDNKWYQIDVTWDGQETWTDYDYFLFGKDKDHVPVTTIVYSDTKY